MQTVFYTRDLLTKYGKIQDLKVPRVRNGGFRPAILPERRRAELDLTSAVISLYAVGVSTKKFLSFWKVFRAHTIHLKAFPG